MVWLCYLRNTLTSYAWNRWKSGTAPAFFGLAIGLESPPPMPPSLSLSLEDSSHSLFFENIQHLFDDLRPSPSLSTTSSSHVTLGPWLSRRITLPSPPTTTPHPSSPLSPLFPGTISVIVIVAVAEAVLLVRPDPPLLPSFILLMFNWEFEPIRSPEGRAANGWLVPLSRGLGGVVCVGAFV